MKKLFLAFALVACFAVSALSQGAPPWTIQEVDGSPRVNSPTLIKVTNGTLSCTGKTCTITISGGGGGSPGGSSTQVQYNAAGSFGGISGFTSDGTNVTAGSGNLRATSPRITTGINDSNGNELILFTATASAINEFTIANAAAGGTPTLSASGGDTDINIRLTPKGVGGVVLSNGSASNAGLRFASDGASVGWYRTAQSWTYTYTGTTQFALPAEGIRLSNGIALTFSTGSAESSGSDTRLVRTGTNTIRLANATTGAGNLIIGTSAGAIGTSGAGVLAFTLSTEPSTGPTDTTQLYYKDFAAGDGRLYLRNEASAAGSPVANLGDAQTFTGRITFSPGATTAGINVGSVAGNPSAPSNADLWYNTATNELYARINGANVALGSGGGGGGITIGTTTITSGTNTRVLYNNSGVVGEYTVTGTAGNVVLSTSPTITTPAITTSATITRDAIGTASSTGFELTNTTAAAAGAQQFSPCAILTSQGWKTAATAASQSTNWCIQNQAVQGSANPTSNLVFASQINGGGYTSQFTLSSAGALTLTGGITSSGNIQGVNFIGNASRWTITAAGGPGSFEVSGGTDTYIRSIGTNGGFTSGVGVGSQDVFFLRKGAANWGFGAADAASPVAQTLAVQNVLGGTSNTAGANFTIAGSRGTGTGAGGDIIFQTAPAGGSGTTQNTLVTTFTIQDDGAVQLKSVTFANLPTVANGYLIYCSDCTIASPCASGGSGALAKGINGAWVCN